MTGVASLAPSASTFQHPFSIPALPRIPSSATNPQFSNLKFHHNYISNNKFSNPRTTTTTTTTTIRHAKLRGVGVEDELEEAFFGVGQGIEEDESEDEETESSLDLLFRFVQSLFKKVSKKAKKATRSILPPVITPDLVSFAVDGILLLTSLSVVKAFLQVVCTLGGTVFATILLLRLIWATVSHFQSSGNRFNPSGNSYGSTQPAT